jgi:hypothetical protein
VLERQGVPDTVEVNGGRFSPKQIVLVYRRPARRLVVEPSSDGWVARAPEALATRGKKVSARPTPGHAATAERPAAPPTMAQSLECPIDPTRADCQSLCVAGAQHEWCP